MSLIDVTRPLIEVVSMRESASEYDSAREKPDKEEEEAEDGGEEELVGVAPNV